MTPEAASKRILDELIARAESRGESLSDVNPASGMTRLEHFKHASTDPARIRSYIEQQRLKATLNRRKANPMSKAEQGRLWEKSTKRDPMRASRDIQVIISEGGSSKGKRQRYNPAKAKKRSFKGKFKRKYVPKAKGSSFLDRMNEKYGDRGTSMNTQDSARDPGKNGSVVLLRSNGSVLRGWYSDDPADRRKNERLLQAWAIEHGYGGAKLRADGNWYCVREPKNSGYKGIRDPESRTSRDFADELRHLSLQALGRLLTKAYRSGDETKCALIEREIDRRGKMARRL